jgi:hypothetical protein
LDLNDRNSLPDISGTYSDPLTPLDRAIDLTRKYLAGRGVLAARRYLEMRRDLPYRILPTGNRRQIIVNREYKPLGWPNKSKFARYEECLSQHIDLSEEALAKCRHPRRTNGLFGDECAPWHSRMDARQYLLRLLALRDHVELVLRPLVAQQQSISQDGARHRVL